MNLWAKLRARDEAGEPVRVGLIGAGKFGAMFLAQAARTPGLHVVGIADRAPARVHAALGNIGWPAERGAARSLPEALASGATHVSEDAAALIAADGLDVVVEATGEPAAGIAHALAAIAHRRHLVMVNVEADALAGPLLARKARAAGVVYSLAYGDQPALICELVDWARTAGFEVVAAGKGTRYQPHFHASTPETVWQHYGLTPQAAAAGGMNPRMFNSFLDGTKSALEMAAVANATGLTPAPGGLAFPPCGTGDLPRLLRPAAQGGVLHHRGQVEVVASEARNGAPLPDHLRWGVYVVFAAADDYVARCFAEYGLTTDDNGRTAAMWKPYHLIGLELGVSVVSVALDGEATGAPDAFRADVVATAKRDLAAGEVLDGEGGATIWGRLMPAADSLALGGLPMGLTQGARLRNAVAADAAVLWADVEIDETAPAVRLRREMEREMAPDKALARGA